MAGMNMDDNEDMTYIDPDSINPSGIKRFKEGQKPVLGIVPRWENHSKMHPSIRGQGRQRSYLPEDTITEQDQANPHGMPRPPIEE